MLMMAMGHFVCMNFIPRERVAQEALPMIVLP